MEKIFTCSLHKGFSPLVNVVNEKLIGNKVNLVLDLKKKNHKIFKKR